MKLSSFFSLAAIALALVGCSSTPNKVESGGPVRARTFNFVIPGPKVLPDFADKTKPVHEVIQQAITKNMADRGVSKVESGGDITVGYLLVVGNNANTASINDYFGYREDLEKLEQRVHEAHGASKNPNYFEAGTLVIDIIDSKTFKLLNRGYTTRPILQSPSPEARAARVQEAVDEILRTVQIKP